MMIRKNIIQNYPVTVEVIETAENIFGPGVSTLKGIKTRQRLNVVVDDSIEIPREMIGFNQELIMCMEIMLINQ